MLLRKIKTTLFLGGVLLFVSCEKELPTFLEYQSYAFSGNDEAGGTWKPILIGSGSAITLDAPKSTTSSEYQAELADMKAAMGQMTSEQRRSVSYWTSNPVTRWNEIALELIAKYNLIPGYNEDGTYTLPSPAAPEGPPAFPLPIRRTPVVRWRTFRWHSLTAWSRPGITSMPTKGWLPTSRMLVSTMPTSRLRFPPIPPMGR